MTSENSNTTGQDNSQSIGQQDHTAKEGDSGPVPASLPTPPHCADEPNFCRYKADPSGKDWLEGIALVAAIGYAVVTFFMWRIAYRDQFGKSRRTRLCYGGASELEKTTARTLLYQCWIGPNDAD